MMWTARRVLVLKDATMNFDLHIVTNSHESSTILLSYNNVVPWLSYVTIDLYFEWFEYWCEDLFEVLTLVSFKQYNLRCLQIVIHFNILKMKR
jgi:hypothetical protein